MSEPSTAPAIYLEQLVFAAEQAVRVLTGREPTANESSELRRLLAMFAARDPRDIRHLQTMAKFGDLRLVRYALLPSQIDELETLERARG